MRLIGVTVIISWWANQRQSRAGHAWEVRWCMCIVISHILLFFGHFSDYSIKGNNGMAPVWHQNSSSIQLWIIMEDSHVYSHLVIVITYHQTWPSSFTYHLWLQYAQIILLSALQTVFYAHHKLFFQYIHKLKKCATSVKLIV